jgi:hypothetical protein
MFERVNQLLGEISKLMSGVSKAVDEDLQEAAKNTPELEPVAADIPPGCERFVLNTRQLKALLAMQASQVSSGCEVVKIKFVLDPGNGIEARIYFKPKKR